MPRRSLALVLAALLLASPVACNGPFVLLPGGELDGELKPVPADWAFAGEYGTCQLETKPEEPYSVNIVYTIVDDALYVNAGDNEAQWVKNIAANPEVRLRIDDGLYALRAERVDDDAEIQAFAKAWTAQSMFRRDPTDYEQVYIFRLVAR